MDIPDHLDLSGIITSEDRFYANGYRGHRQNPEIISISGTIPILLAAPHAVEHPRNNSYKKADALTGTIVTQLCQQTGAHGLILGRTNGEDPNFDEAGPFKGKLKDILISNSIHCVINLHGMAREHPWDLVFGSAFGQALGNNPEYLSHTVQAMQQTGFKRLLIDDQNLFPATNPNNLCLYSWLQCQTPSFQIEINRDFRDPTNQPHNYHQLLTGLLKAIKEISKFT